MIDSIIDAIVARFHSAIDFITDPFWGWLFIALGIALAVIVIVYFFGGWLPALRPIGGVILLILTAGLIAYRKGENDQKATDAKRAPKPKPRPPAWPPLFK
jgi:hypothetical protein